MNKQSAFSKNRGYWFISLLLAAVLIFTGSAQSYSVPEPEPLDEQPFETISLPKTALSADSLNDTKSMVLKNARLDSVLVELVTAAKSSEQSALAIARSKSLRLLDNLVHVQVVVDPSALKQVERAMADSGGQQTKVSQDSSVIQGWLPVNALEPFSTSKGVNYIRVPIEPVLFEDIKAGASTTEGLAVMNGPDWHSAGFTGTGVKIGIIDGGFQGYNSLLGTDLPASVTVKNFVDGEVDGDVDGTSIHGTACAEIVYDIAPSATLYLAKIATNLDLQEAVTWLKDTNQVDIISTSLGWYNLTPGDGTGEFADLVQSARDAGILWTTAAGNDREAHWGGAYYDPDVNGYHNFNGDQEVNYFGPGDGGAWLIPSGYLFRVALRWDDWTVVDQDYDLLLVRWNESLSTWEIIAAGDNYQNGTPGQQPTELASVLTYGDPAPYGFVIAQWDSTRNVNLEVFAPKLDTLDEIVTARSLSNLADAPAAMTVAALDVTSPYPQESYSSEGPTNGPGGTADGGFNKPDISGFANVSTESYGAGIFNGTSSATPHAAGAAALVLSAFPAYTPSEIQTYLQGHAVDMGISGPDTIYGYGRLYLGDPPVIGPIISDISPNSGSNDGITQVSITGTGFVSGAAVKLTKTGQTDITASNVNVSVSTSITADLDLTGAVTGLWNVVVTNPDEGSDQLSDGFTVTEDGELSLLFLPMLMKNFPVTPAIPVLNSIENADGNGAYTVSWLAADYADTYILQEDDNAGFTSPDEIYNGSSLDKAVSGKDIGTYYYRVKGANAYRESDWSNVESVVVTVPPPDCPQTGQWTGTTDQGRQISFEVEISTECQIVGGSLSISKRDSCYYVTTTTFFNPYPIINDHFSTGAANSSVIGDFSSSTSANGTYYFSMVDPYEPWINCTVSGTWTAAP